VGKHIVRLVLVVSEKETVGLVRRSRHQRVHVIVMNVGVGKVLCACVSK